MVDNLFLLLYSFHVSLEILLGKRYIIINWIIKKNFNKSCMWKSEFLGVQKCIIIHLVTNYVLNVKTSFASIIINRNNSQIYEITLTLLSPKSYNRLLERSLIIIKDTVKPKMNSPRIFTN